MNLSELFRHAFGWVCGQNPAHTWSPGGELLPLCQRCTGVYVGALVALVLHLAWRPKPTPRWLWLNGAFLLFMVPSGFYWIPQNPELRSASGIVFGFGLVAFLWLTLPDRFFFSSRREEAQTGISDSSGLPRVGFYKMFAAVLLTALVFTPLLAEKGNHLAGAILSLACAGGALVLAVLLLINVLFFLRWATQKIFTKTT
jgi:uncharacterized membrane protein